jgi:DNA polymerase elongation subunit (family B)
VTEQQPTGVVESVVHPLRILYFDTETSPMLAYVWGPKADWIPHNQIVHQSFLFCWAAKWGHEKQLRSDKLTSNETKVRDDTRIVESLASLVREADVVIAHNSDGFDVPVLNSRVMIQGLEPLGPVESVDTLKLARRSFRFSHNKLDALARYLGIGEKIRTDFELWERVYQGDELAMQQMLRYCRHDVVLLEQVFEKLRPYAKGLKRLVDGEGSFCPNCGSTDYQRRGFRRTNAGNFARYQCNRCQRYFKDKTSDAGKSQMRPL